MTMSNVVTPLDLIRPEDLYEGFDVENPPDPANYWDPEAMAPSEEWNRLRAIWVKVKTYQALHSPKYVAAPDTYEIPRPLKTWADRIIAGEAPHPLLVFGTVGVGKTWGVSAMACYLAAFWDRKVWVEAPPIAFRKASRMVSQLKNFGSGDAREDVHFEVVHAKVLVVDDLTRAKLTDFDMETIGELVDARTDAKLPTIFTVNHSPDTELTELMPAFLASRLGQGQQIMILGPDRRAA